MYRRLTTLVVITLAACASTDDRAALEGLEGTYADPTPYPYGDAFGQRVFTFEDGRWTLDFVLGLDPALERRVFRFRTFGDYRVVGPSESVDGAWDAVFVEEEKHLTLLTADAGLAEAFGLAACGLAVGVETDVSAEGCALWKPVAECGDDHDLLARTSEGGLRFGVRPADNDMCTADRRPTSLTPPVMPR